MRWIVALDSRGNEVQIGVDAEGQFWISENAPPVRVAPADSITAMHRKNAVVLRLPNGRELSSADLDTMRIWFPPSDEPPRRQLGPGTLLWMMLAGSLLLVYLTVRFIIPSLGDWATAWVPRSFERTLQGPVQASLTAEGFGESKLAADRQEHYRELFKSLLTEVSEPTDFQLQFRSFDVPNAFALPGGVIVFTDPMFDLIASDAEFMAVAAHEIGHVEHRHIVRNLLRASTMTLVFALLAGDLSSALALANSVPGILLSSAYSREFESEADQFAFAELKKRQLSPVVLGEFLQKLSAQTGGDMPGVLRYASSHPATEDRIEAAREAAEKP